MNWKTKQLIMILFGGLSIICFFMTFFANDYILRVINTLIFGISFFIALGVKLLVKIEEAKQ